MIVFTDVLLAYATVLIPDEASERLGVRDEVAQAIEDAQKAATSEKTAEDIRALAHEDQQLDEMVQLQQRGDAAEKAAAEARKLLDEERRRAAAEQEALRGDISRLQESIAKPNTSKGLRELFDGIDGLMRPTTLPAPSAPATVPTPSPAPSGAPGAESTQPFAAYPSVLARRACGGYRVDGTDYGDGPFFNFPDNAHSPDRGFLNVSWQGSPALFGAAESFMFTENREETFDRITATLRGAPSSTDQTVLCFESAPDVCFISLDRGTSTNVVLPVESGLPSAEHMRIWELDDDCNLISNRVNYTLKSTDDCIRGEAAKKPAIGQFLVHEKYPVGGGFEATAVGVITDVDGVSFAVIPLSDLATRGETFRFTFSVADYKKSYAAWKTRHEDDDGKIRCAAD